jgi:hypothetical protein
MIDVQNLLVGAFFVNFLKSIIFQVFSSSRAAKQIMSTLVALFFFPSSYLFRKSGINSLSRSNK